MLAFQFQDHGLLQSEKLSIHLKIFLKFLQSFFQKYLILDILPQKNICNEPLFKKTLDIIYEKFQLITSFNDLEF